MGETAAEHFIAALNTRRILGAVKSATQAESPAVFWARAGAAIAVMTALVGWPFLDGMSLASDDVTRMLVTQRLGSTWVALQAAWHGSLFRPLLVISAFLVDPETRAAPGVILLHALALAIGLGAVRALAARGLRAPVSPWLASLLWLLHPATAVSIWQMDTVSQTASAAAGLWLLAISCGAVMPRRRELCWTCIALIGLFTKETFLGWLPACALLELYNRRKLGSGVWVALVLAGVFVAARMSVLGPAAIGHGDERYALHLDSVVLKNAATLAVGGLAFGPIHVLRLLSFRELAWWPGLLGVICHLLVLTNALYREPSLRRDVVVLWSLAIISAGPVLLMGHVSELYLMGPNAMIALALAACVQGLQLEHRFCRAAFGLLFCCSVWGFASRAYHFGLTWQYSRVLASRVPALADAQRAQRPHRPCAEGLKGHSVYVVSPLEALNYIGTEELMADDGDPLPEGWTARIDCSGLPARARW